ncbi:hypothetical protein [Piscirickettsia salmonis]|uniref:hypothetical protein n=1 Tax=Piscirickettsia salmonis TaxID=1238 RepID=UPI0006BDA90D|nr:hypothetical protein [Piscirickettsia salmonis]ALA26687.1 short-chain dehydrogenase [Piscirickettsia salmonis]APS45896.1 hypothetical protein AVI48_15820 [Piscirickettsia salmonis]APS49221.1 hypothetical protein AVI49_16305 [Piscirickettsia salmonis]QGO82302.1 hypothetical protein Psal107_03353 [Piscirickettsia salmonis]QGP24131.1 hypothetical protein Psal158_03305 [Piscirickettsia salmonis]
MQTIQLEYGCHSDYLASVYVKHNLSDEEMMCLAFTVDILIGEMEYNYSDQEKEYCKFPLYWRDLLVKHFGAVALGTPDAKNYHREDFEPLIDCGDAGPDYNEIVDELFTPFNVTYEQLQETFVESVKRYASVEIGVDPCMIRPV